MKPPDGTQPAVAVQSVRSRRRLTTTGPAARAARVAALVGCGSGTVQRVVRERGTQAVEWLAASPSRKASHRHGWATSLRQGTW